QRRTRDARDLVPEALAAPRPFLGVELGAMQAVVLPGEPAVGHPAQVVLEAAAEQLGIAAGVERQRALDDLLDGRELCGRGHELLDPPGALLPSFRTGVHDDQRREPRGVTASV